jgi:hypothetical protein
MTPRSLLIFDKSDSVRSRTKESLSHVKSENFFFFGKLTHVLKEEDTNIIRGIPQIYNDNRNIKQQMATG